MYLDLIVVDKIEGSIEELMNEAGFIRTFITPLSEEEKSIMRGEGLHSYGLVKWADGPESGYCTPYSVTGDRVLHEGVNVGSMTNISLRDRLMAELRHIAAEVKDYGAQALVLAVERECERPVVEAFREMGYEIRRYGVNRPAMALQGQSVEGIR